MRVVQDNLNAKNFYAYNPEFDRKAQTPIQPRGWQQPYPPSKAEQNGEIG